MPELTAEELRAIFEKAMSTDLENNFTKDCRNNYVDNLLQYAWCQWRLCYLELREL